MQMLHQFLLVLHVVCGALALCVFWGPMLAKKGSPWHVRSGHWYSTLMYLICGAGILMCALVLSAPLVVKAADLPVGQDPQVFAERVRLMSGFLLLLCLLALMNLRQGLLALQAGAARVALKHWSHQALVLITFGYAIWTLWQAVPRQFVLGQIFGAIALFSSIGCLRYIHRASVEKSTILKEHIGNMLASGIAIFTAFFAFGGRKVLDFSPELQLVSWVLPSVLGIAATFWYNKRYVKARVGLKTAAAR